MAAVVIIAGLPVQAADLPKLRNFPVNLPGVPAELIRQYEYNPDIGPYGTREHKLISLTDAKTGQTSASTWGIDLMQQGVHTVVVYVYRGFTALSWTSIPVPAMNCGPLPNTSAPTQMKLIKDGPWPSRSFKIYTEQVNENYALTCGYYKDGRRERFHTKTLMECAQQHTSTLNGLPGKVYAYRCDITNSGDYEGANPTTQQGVRYLYSDYLDTVIAVRVPGLDEATGRTRTQLNFKGLDGGTQGVMVDNFDF
ncbi:hypothetical protein [Pseudomonas sp. NPDC007930]|uniref:hypothetical protein n=1 Tax=Pseudomonas sp. NPDC007930 TaxID=3364417 RepID=UPI0036E175DF